MSACWGFLIASSHFDRSIPSIRRILRKILLSSIAPNAARNLPKMPFCLRQSFVIFVEVDGSFKIGRLWATAGAFMRTLSASTSWIKIMEAGVCSEIFCTFRGLSQHSPLVSGFFLLPRRLLMPSAMWKLAVSCAEESMLCVQPSCRSFAGVGSGVGDDDTQPVNTAQLGGIVHLDLDQTARWLSVFTFRNCAKLFSFQFSELRFYVAFNRN